MRTPTFRQRVIAANNALNSDKERTHLRREQFDWAEDNIVKHVAYYRKNKDWLYGKYTCMDCYEEFSLPQSFSGTVVCPHCGRQLTVEASRKKKYEQHYTLATFDIVDHIQVVRIWERFFYRNANHKESYRKDEEYYHEHYEHKWFEVERRWFDTDGTSYTTSRGLVCYPYYSRSPWSNIDIKMRPDYGYYNNTRSYFEHNYTHVDGYCPYGLLTDIYKQRGIDLSTLTKDDYLDDVLSYITTNSAVETLWKAGYHGVAEAWSREDIMRHRVTSMDNYWAALKICMRNHYHIEDVKLYFDYLDDLIYLKKDLHNAFYVCPENIVESHEKTNTKVRAIKAEIERIALEKRREEQAKKDKEKARFRRLFADIYLTDGNVTLSVLISQKEYTDEGNHMHHCVGGYWSRTDSIILSAKVDGKRHATIELRISDWRIMQIRGVSNSVPQFYDDIKNLIEKNIQVFIDAAAGKRRKRKPKSMKSIAAMLEESTATTQVALAI